MEQQLNELYHPLILEHNQHPRHYEKHPEAGVILDAYNSLCGDKFKLYLDIKEGRVVQASFSGYGCAVSKAATSVLVDKIQGKTLEEVKILLGDYFAATKTEHKLAIDIDPDLLAFAAAKKFPGRLKCAVLSWEAMEEYLQRR
ncbi:Fe-S cluster assembly sulfur transfer protein SufU [Haliscomenobacter hydrossis]|uniref:SUF system FeS assembly protein, NifU family n=1 Tax=Haliscomenobacter hydrossis (strain ATCC 27775 / DSM 1100 / LMG 10767 / O) TaxID=760192 RepID=F4L7K4_HALH1|nr:SUF system NifU family Fe-S cluster assembly protein [Haliscomenobacter hydrossis]AEE54184.1 SUF system FeS assembly protein, NifU family [Haliscomenobacter hydrossis DSM 1100]